MRNVLLTTMVAFGALAGSTFAVEGGEWSYSEQVAEPTVWSGVAQTFDELPAEHQTELRRFWKQAVGDAGR